MAAEILSETFNFVMVMIGDWQGLALLIIGNIIIGILVARHNRNKSKHYQTQKRKAEKQKRKRKRKLSKEQIKW